jgi:predicted Zn-ribbon and HTH transcriptional regulator
MPKEWMSCPKCQSELIDAGHFDSNEDYAWRVATCEICGFEWQEVFTFDHNEDLDTNELDDNGDVIK